MTRRLIVCIDGTWNSSAEKSDFPSYPTNVERISQFLLNDGKTQRVIYVPGVGTRGFADRVVGGVWGAGTTQRICDGYRFLCEHYEANDQVSLFGFSRGAFAVRSIIGLLINFGVLRLDQLHHVPEAVSLYRRPHSNWNPSDVRSFAETHCWEGKPQIAFVGVWDTVIRYGPLLAPLQVSLERMLGRFGLVDHHIPHTVGRFCHALALDECRAAFWPWRAERLKDCPPDQVEELWFAGSHSDVGGGYKNSRPAEFPLRWMCERAAAAGLEFHSMPTVGEDSHCASLNPSRTGIWRILPWRKRTVKDVDCLHDSVERRIRSTDYRPKARLSAEMLGRLTRA